MFTAPRSFLPKILPGALTEGPMLGLRLGPGLSHIKDVSMRRQVGRVVQDGKGVDAGAVCDPLQFVFLKGDAIPNELRRQSAATHLPGINRKRLLIMSVVSLLDLLGGRIKELWWHGFKSTSIERLPRERVRRVRVQKQGFQR